MRGSGRRRRGAIAALALGLLAWPTAASAGLSLAPGDAPAALEDDTAGLEIRARVTPRRETVLSAEIDGRLERITVREGERVEEGDLLFEVECSVQEAERERAAAALDMAESTAEVKARLARLKSISVLEHRVAEAEARQAAAELRLNDAVLAKCSVHAPFAGRVSARHADAFQHVAAGDPVLELVDDGQPGAEMIVPSRWLAWLRVGDPFSIVLDETQTAYPARISRIGARINPVSQSIKVFAEVDCPEGRVVPGMSGRAIFDAPSR